MQRPKHAEAESLIFMPNIFRLHRLSRLQANITALQLFTVRAALFMLKRCRLLSSWRCFHVSHKYKEIRKIIGPQIVKLTQLFWAFGLPTWK